MSKLTPVEQLREIVKIQTADGNWNSGHYMHGMANGLILALSIIEDEVPKFLDAPKHWGCSNYKEKDE